MRSRWPLILFDLDGTLVDSFADIVAGIRVGCAAIGVDCHADLEQLAGRGVPLEDFYHAAVGVDPTLPAERERFERFAQAYRAHYMPSCTLATKPFPGVVDTLRALRQLEPRPILGVATTKRGETARAVLAGTGLAPLIDHCFGCDGIPPKPDPAVLARVATAAGLPLSAAVMIGDTDRDILAARRAGCAAIGVTWGGFSKSELATLAPDHIIDTMPDLLTIVGFC